MPSERDADHLLRLWDAYDDLSKWVHLAQGFTALQLFADGSGAFQFCPSFKADAAEPPEWIDRNAANQLSWKSLSAAVYHLETLVLHVRELNAKKGN